MSILVSLVLVGTARAHGRTCELKYIYGHRIQVTKLYPPVLEHLLLDSEGMSRRAASPAQFMTSNDDYGSLPPWSRSSGLRGK